MIILPPPTHNEFLYKHLARLIYTYFFSWWLDPLFFLEPSFSAERLNELLLISYELEHIARISHIMLKKMFIILNKAQQSTQANDNNYYFLALTLEYELSYADFMVKLDLFWSSGSIKDWDNLKISYCTYIKTFEKTYYVGKLLLSRLCNTKENIVFFPEHFDIWLLALKNLMKKFD